MSIFKYVHSPIGFTCLCLSQQRVEAFVAYLRWLWNHNNKGKRHSWHTFETHVVPTKKHFFSCVVDELITCWTDNFWFFFFFPHWLCVQVAYPLCLIKCRAQLSIHYGVGCGAPYLPCRCFEFTIVLIEATVPSNHGSFGLQFWQSCLPHFYRSNDSGSVQSCHSPL